MLLALEAPGCISQNGSHHTRLVAPHNSTRGFTRGRSGTPLPWQRGTGQCLEYWAVIISGVSAAVSGATENVARAEAASPRAGHLAASGSTQNSSEKVRVRASRDHPVHASAKQALGAQGAQGAAAEVQWGAHPFKGCNGYCS